MLTMTRAEFAFQDGDSSWWQAIEPGAADAAHQVEVQTAPPVNFDWCEVRHVSLGATPHRVQFRREPHTLLVFDRGSFVHGERWIDGARLSTSGPLDVGLDVVPAHAQYQALAGPGSCVGCTMISFAVDCLDQAQDAGIGSGSSLRPSVALSGNLVSLLADRIRQSGQGQPGISDALYVESLCTVLFREVLLAQEQNCPSPARPTGGLSARAQRVIKEFLYQQESQGQKVSLQELADLAGISRFHFTRAFKVSFGVPPHKYLLNLRLRKAADLLRATRLPITDIALSVGFSCSSEFARAFKEATDYTPREFRQGNRQPGGVGEKCG